MIQWNNPGNLRPLLNGQLWLGQSGQIQGKDGTYCLFLSPEYGIRAIAKNLLSYKAIGINTLEIFAETWAPGADQNDPESYAAFVSEQLKVGPKDTLDFANPTILFGMVKAITLMENGHPQGDAVCPNGNWYPDQLFLLGVNLALQGA